MKIKLHNSLKASFFVLLILFSAVAFSQPASCTATIGTPANGLQHHITITWSAVGGATAYRLDYSTDNVTWINALDSGTATTYDHDASNQGNVPFYYRVSSFTGGTQSAYVDATPFPIYTACDTPSVPIITSAGTTSLTVQLVPESPTPNSSATTYAIYCPTTGQYIQANGTLGANPVWQTMAAWGTVTVTGLTTGTSYCFYAEAMNGNGDIRTNTGATLSATQTFNTSGTLYTGNGSTTTLWYSPGTCTYGGMTWQSTGGCTGGTGAGCVGFTQSPTSFGAACFLRSPLLNCSGMSTITMTFDLTNSASTLGDSVYFDIWSNGANNYFPACTTCSPLVASSIDLNVARNCELMTVVFNLSSIPSADRSALYFYLTPFFYESTGTPFDVLFDNITFNQQPDAECATPEACTATTISTNPSNQTICATNNTSFSVTTAGGAAGTYQWQVSTNSGGSWSNINNGGVYTNATTATLNITNATAGMSGYEYQCLVTGSCSGTPTSLAGTLTINSVPSAAGAITGSATVCQGQNSITYSVSAVTGATGYTWSLPTGASIVSGNNTVSITVDYATTATSGNVGVTPTNTCGSGTAATPFAVTVDQIPVLTGSITGNASPCSNTSQTYSVSSATGATSYTWTLPNGWTGTSATNSITATTGTTGGTISVTANNTCGNSTALTLPVSILNTPATPGVINGPNPACIGITGEYSVASVTGATSYTWTLPSGWGGSSATDSISVGVGTTGGAISVTAHNTCGTSAAQSLTVSATTAPSTPGTITGLDPVCSGTSQNYSIVAVTGASFYTWTLPNGWTGTSTSDVIVTTTGSASGAISVTANNSCGSSAAQTLIITTNSVPATPSSITGSALICSGGTGTYSVAPVTGATFYAWSIPNGWTGNSVTDSIAVTTNAVSGTISVTANNTCGASQAKSTDVTIGALPQPVLTATDTTICSNDSTYICTTSNFSSYLWNTQQTTACIYATAAGNYYVTVTDNNSCTAQSAHLAIAVHSVPSVSIVVNGDTLSTYGQVSYQWLYNGNPIPGANSPVYVADSTGAYSIQVTDANKCTATSNPVSVVKTGITNLQETSIEIYPNPLSSGNWQLVVGDNLVGSMLEIYDVNGQLVFRSGIRTAKSEIPLQVSSGIYFLNIIAGNKVVAVKKLVKIE